MSGNNRCPGPEKGTDLIYASHVMKASLLTLSRLIAYSASNVLPVGSRRSRSMGHGRGR
jgi:hypothetical protein